MHSTIRRETGVRVRVCCITAGSFVGLLGVRAGLERTDEYLTEIRVDYKQCIFLWSAETCHRFGPIPKWDLGDKKPRLNSKAVTSPRTPKNFSRV
jgi:hypothetical protein